MLTLKDLEAVAEDENYAGWGYIHERQFFSAEQVAVADAKVLDHFNDMELNYFDLFNWANSKNGRWFGDAMFGCAGKGADSLLPKA